MVSEAKKRANMKSDKKNAKYVTLKLNKNTDKDILEYLKINKLAKTREEHIHE